jgi:hypothetical protein
VAELGEKGLLDKGPSFISERVPRRQALRRLAGAGLAAATGPLVLSVAVPNAFAAASSQTIYYVKQYNGNDYIFALTVTGGTVTACTGSTFTIPSECHTASPGFYGSCSDVTYRSNYPATGQVSVASTLSGEVPQQAQSWIVCGSNHYHPTAGSGNLTGGNNGNGNTDGYLVFTCGSSHGTSC